MLSSLASIPGGVASFVKNRRKTFTWVAGTVGGAYLLGQWGLRRMGEMAEKARIEGADRDNLARRFKLNQEDCQFTVLALLPTLSKQLMEEMDVESCSKELAELAQKSKKEQREQDEQEREKVEQQRKEEEQKQKEEEAAKTVQDGELAPVDAPAGSNDDDKSAAPDASPADSASDPPEVAADGPSSSDDNPPTSYADAAAPAASPVLASTTKLSAEAPPFSPSGFAGAAAVPVVEEEQVVEDEPQPSESVLLSRSWAEVVAKGDDKAEEVGSESIAALPEPVAEEQPSNEPEKPERTRAELWEEIKILSFTRTLTSLYLLTLLTLQTHVQLSLLGRASYVSSVLSSLPPTPSPEPLTQEMSYDEDLELALYGEKVKQEEREVGVSKDDERKYLTFSWWLLNEGWKSVGERVKQAVEEVVGPMGLKNQIVYGELSTLLGQIRQKVDFNSDGSLYDFSSALFPHSPSDEHRTLLSGGISLSNGPPVSPSLRRLLNETSDTLDAADCTLVRKLLLDRLFVQLVEGLEGAFKVPPAAEGEMGSRFEDISERQARLAGLLPTVARQSKRVMDDVPNEYLVALEDVRELTEFSAIVYSSFDRDNVRGSC